MKHGVLEDQRNNRRRSAAVRGNGLPSERDRGNRDASSLVDRLLAFQIDKRNPLPIYLQISNFILGVLATTAIPPGTLLPPERILCERFGISKMTLRQAYSLLVQKGCLEAQRGVGTFVLGSRIEKKISGMLSFSEEVKARGGIPSSRLLKIGLSSASSGAAEFFHLGIGDHVFEIQRLRYNNELPLAIETVQLPRNLFPGLESFDWRTESLYTVIEEHYGLKLSRCNSEIMAIPANREQARLLNLSVASPLLSINRKSYSVDNMPVEFTVTCYPGNRYIATSVAIRDA